MLPIPNAYYLFSDQLSDSFAFLSDLYAKFETSFKEKNKEQYEQILKDNAEIIHGKETFLHLAAMNGEVKIVEYLIEQKFDVNAKNELGVTPLHLAAFNGEKKVAEILIEKGAEVDAQDIKNGCAPSHYAAYNGYSEVLELLLDRGANKNLSTKQGDTLLHLTIDHPHTLGNSHAFSSKTFDLLLKSGVELNLSNKEYWPPLHLAVKRKNVYAMKQLLEKGADVNTMANSKTPLHLVVKDRYPAGIELLIAKGANVNAHYGRERPLDVAIREGYYECEEILRKHHAVPSTSLTVAKAYSLAQSTGCQIL